MNKRIYELRELLSYDFRSLHFISQNPTSHSTSLTYLTSHITHHTYRTYLTILKGFDEYMNLVLDEAEELSLKTKSRKPIGMFYIFVVFFVFVFFCFCFFFVLFLFQ
jgi:hypothetical protein